MKPLCYTVPAALNGARLSVFLRAQGLSAGLTKAVKYHGGGFFADGAPVFTDAAVLAGQRITFCLPPEKDTGVTPQPVAFSILLEDDFVAVLNKPAGLAVHPTLNYPDHTLANGWLYHLEQQGRTGIFRPVNRLDKNTSGLVLCAQNAFAAPALASTAHKRYLAVASGKLPLGPGEIDAPIGRRGDSIIGRCVSPQGKPSLTRYTVLDANPAASLLLCETVTGRTHQIRVHCAWLGHPLFGDSLYGGPAWPCQEDGGETGRQALHCTALRFVHPAARQTVLLTAPPPPDMRRLSTALSLALPTDEQVREAAAR